MAKLVDPETLWDAALEVADELHAAGASQRRTAHAVAEFLDAVVPLDVLLPGLPGVVAERLDGPAFEQAVRMILEFLQVDPAKRAERKALRAERRAERHVREQARR